MSPVRRSATRERSGIGSRSGKLSTGTSCDELSVERHGREPARHGLHTNAELLEEPARGGFSPSEHVGTEVEPHPATRLREDPAAGPLAGLEHDDVPVAERVSRGQAGDPPADDDHLTLFDVHVTIWRGRSQVPGVRLAQSTICSAEIGSEVTVTPYSTSASSIAALKIAGVSIRPPSPAPLIP